ncbi:biotin--[acetyl-CoA-carboxylase] ligase [Candidatus Bathyarchaeota archaeon]|nr:MAG: biotin--[acetyl-CoA-carboxylase] ligase [Candidatus Bathyarchaeota archaeon]
MSAKLKVNKLQNGLGARSFGRTIFYSSNVDSTNKWAKELAMYGACEGTVVIAETQTMGTGRLGRQWFSPTGGLWFSLILRPNLCPAETIQLTFVSGLAVTRVLREMFGLKAETKWPNDVLVKGRKICGILAEMNTTGENVNFVVVGVGVNANCSVEKLFPEQLKKVATSIENELGRKVQLEELFKALLEQLENLYELFINEGFDPIREEWKKYASFLGRRVKITSQTREVSGLALEIDHDGALVLRLEDGTEKRFFIGDVSLQA